MQKKIMPSFSIMIGAMLLAKVSNMVYSQRVFLSSNNPTPCFNGTVDLICYYPDVMKRVNGQPRYAAFTASYRVDGNPLFPDENVFDQSIINQTASRLRVSIDPANFTGVPVSFTCFLLLSGGGEDSNSTVVNPQDTAAPPTLSVPVVEGSYVRITWHHTTPGPCFTNLIFSYNITWYPVVDGVPLRGEGQSGVTGPGATAYTITNLMNGTVYQVELFGFTSSDPVVYSEVATVSFATKVCPPTIGTPVDDGSDNTVTIAAAVSTVFVVVIVVASAISLAITVLYIRHIRRRENYITDEENAGSRAGTPMPTASKQKDEGEETADASVQYNSGDEAVSITSCSEEAAVACSDSEEQTKEHRSDQFQEKHKNTVDTRMNLECSSIS